jgi:hypothetical protein
MKITKKLGVLLVALLVTAFAGAQEKKPASPPATAKGTIGHAEITIDYSSPSVKGREIWGALVPYGQVWRAGANAPTTFTTSQMIAIEGQELPAGTYALYVIPEKNESIVIFGKDKSIGANKYDKSKDAIRVKVKNKKSSKMNESLVYTVNKDNVTLSWENVDIPMKVIYMK